MEAPSAAIQPAAATKTLQGVRKQCMVDRRNDTIYITLTRNQRGTQAQRVIELGKTAISSPDQHAILHAMSCHSGGMALAHWRFTGAIRYQLNTGKQALTAHIADLGMLELQLLQARQEAITHGLDITE